MMTIGLVSREMLGDQAASSGKRAKDCGRTGTSAYLNRYFSPI